jgi:hypothetical protein
MALQAATHVSLVYWKWGKRVKNKSREARSTKIILRGEECILREGRSVLKDVRL